MNGGHSTSRLLLDSNSHEVLGKIGRDSSEWEAMVPPTVAATIKERKLFGYR